MATLMESSGVKELPEGVTLDSFQTLCTVDARNTSKHEPRELATAIQVRCA